jgi:hypothetical protein
MMTPQAFNRIDKPEQINALLTGIAFKCPLDGNAEGCVIAELHELPIRERLDRLGALTPDQKRCLYREHLLCLQSREIENTA